MLATSINDSSLVNMYIFKRNHDSAESNETCEFHVCVPVCSACVKVCLQGLASDARNKMFFAIMFSNLNLSKAMDDGALTTCGLSLTCWGVPTSSN